MTITRRQKFRQNSKVEIYVTHQACEYWENNSKIVAAWLTHGAYAGWRSLQAGEHKGRFFVRRERPTHYATFRVINTNMAPAYLARSYNPSHRWYVFMICTLKGGTFSRGVCHPYRFANSGILLTSTDTLVNLQYNEYSYDCHPTRHHEVVFPHTEHPSPAYRLTYWPALPRDDTTD
jgi:hypothetical protein